MKRYLGLPIFEMFFQVMVLLAIGCMLLVHACSKECVSKIPTPPKSYVQTPHRGGLDLQQPPTHW